MCEQADSGSAFSPGNLKHYVLLRRKKIVKKLMLHAKLHLQLSTEVYRNEPKTHVWFKEQYQHKIIKRDSVHAGQHSRGVCVCCDKTGELRTLYVGIVGHSSARFATDWALMADMFKGGNNTNSCRREAPPPTILKLTCGRINCLDFADHDPKCRWAWVNTDSNDGVLSMIVTAGSASGQFC